MNKICTSLKQSQKLVELGVDINTVDMYYSYDYNINKYDDDAQIIPQSELGQHFSLFPEDIPAWSLSALIDALPLVETHKQTDGYKVYYYVELYMRRMKKEIYLSTERHESLVDACVEMLLKLHERKLL